MWQMRGVPGRGLVLGLLLCGVSCTARAGFVNGSFQSGSFTGWTTSGDAKVVGDVGSPVIPPPQGSFQAGLGTNGDVPPFPPPNPTTDAAALESFFGLSAGALNAIRSPNTNSAYTVVAGSGIYQTVTVGAGDVVSFSWDFGTRELASEGLTNDFAFAVIGTTATRLQSADDSVFGPLAGPDVTLNGDVFRTSGYETFSVRIPTAGTFRIGVGVVNVGDDEFNSALLADSFQSVPEPGSLCLLALGLLGLIGGHAARLRLGTMPRRGG